MKTLAAATLFLSLAISGTAYAQDPAAQQEALAHNEASNAAMDAGDYDKGMEEAVAAWRAAERGWGDDPNTAALAMLVTTGYLDLGNPAAARDAAARTLALAPMADGAYSEGDAHLWNGMALMGADPAAARRELEAGLAAAPTPSEDTVRGGLMLAALQLPSGGAETALATAQKAVDDSRAIRSPGLRGHLFELGKLQYLAGQFAASSATLTESLNLWERQPVGDLNPVLADTLAWQTIAAQAVIRSTPEGAGPAGRGGRFGGFGRVWSFVPERANCEVEYEDLPWAPLPGVTGDTVTLGASVVMWDLDENGAATNVRIVGSAPDAAHHEEYIKEYVSQRKARRFVREPCRAARFETVSYEF